MTIAMSTFEDEVRTDLRDQKRPAAAVRGEPLSVRVELTREREWLTLVAMMTRRTGGHEDHAER